MLSPQWTLIAGIVLSFFIRKPEITSQAKLWSSRLLQASVILLGASLDFNHVLKEGTSGVLTTAGSILIVFALGFIGMKLLKLEQTLATLITMGTAICGGSAIGALAPVLGASSVAVTMSIGIVFLLNALAVFIFPPIGHYFSLTQEQFGLWSALAVHDTSAVVASSSIYGTKALAVATMIKLTRALWIIPIVILFTFLQKNQRKGKITIPWFIFGFVACSLSFTFIPQLLAVKEMFIVTAKTGFAVTLFLIGLTFNPRQLREVGAMPFIFGIVLWIIVSLSSLYFVTH